MRYIKYREFIKYIEEEIKKCGEADPINNPIPYGISIGLKEAFAYANVLTLDIEVGDKSIVFNNKDGCEWCDGVGTSPKGYFCGECDMIEKDSCPVRRNEEELLKEQEKRLTSE